LPRRESTREDFQWVRREIVEGGGDASVCEARFVEGLDDREVEALFRAARDADYRELATSVRALAEARGQGKRRRQGSECRAGLEGRRGGEEGGSGADLEGERLKGRLSEIVAIDFFSARGRSAAQESIASLEPRPSAATSPKTSRARPARFRGRTWATRKGVF